MVESMRKNNTLNSADENEEEQDPTVYLWLLYYSAQHYLFIKNYPEAFKYINEAISHTPTVVDLYIVKAKIYKKAGDREKASQLYNEARKLDLADRYLNAGSSKYKIKND
jgi:peptide alpha-N-acetyltransferase